MDTTKKALYRVILKDIRNKSKGKKVKTKTFTVYGKNSEAISFEEFAKIMESKTNEL